MRLTMEQCFARFRKRWVANTAEQFVICASTSLSNDLSWRGLGRLLQSWRILCCRAPRLTCNDQKIKVELTYSFPLKRVWQAHLALSFKSRFNIGDSSC